MKSVLVLLAFTAFMALAFAGGRRMGGCRAEYEDPPECAGLRRGGGDSGHGRGRDAGQGCGGCGKRRDNHDDDDDDDDDYDHVYRFQLGENFGAYEYLDESGHLQGFILDLLQAVCKKAGKTCAYLLDTYGHCWQTTGEREYPGVGLLDSWYDGCLGMMPTPDRLNSFNFTSAFTPNVKAALHWRQKDDVGDRHNLTGRKIGVIDGWAFSPRCLKRQYNITGDGNFQVVAFRTHQELVNALLHKDVDAIITVEVFDSQRLGIVAEEPWFYCTERGMSVMTQYYSDVIPWWNCALARLQRSGEFKELCEQSQKRHAEHGDIRCV